MIPDIHYPSLFDPEQIGESALDNALAWDQIAPARFSRYNDYRAILPTLTDLHERRAANDPDYLYLEDQVSLAREARTITALPLRQAGRLEMRDDQEQKALAIENKRRVAKGLERLSTRDAEESADDTKQLEANVASEAPAHGGDEDSLDDVLLMETGRILVDAITLRPNASLASRHSRAGR